MLTKKWHLLPDAPVDIVQHLSRSLDISAVTALILAQRNIIDPKQAKIFLKPDLHNLAEPHLIPGVPEALNRIEQALRNNERILVYGDYDVDGITSVVLLKRFFRLLCREIDFYIPHRLNEGYGLSMKSMDTIAQKGVNLIITVDCGISNPDEIAYAKKLGMDVIVTDHHEVPPALPDCIVVNPKLGVYPDSHFLAGVGIAYKLCWSLMNTFSSAKKNTRVFHDFLMDSIVLVALGTIADVAPLTGENRILCTYGLEALRQTRIAGLKALIKQTGLENAIIKSDDVAFRLGPRLNAPGRMGFSRCSAELLLLSDFPSEIEKIEKLVNQIEEYNRERQKIQNKIFKQISATLEKEFDPLGDKEKNFVICLSDDKWHPGVLGIVASKIADEFYRPVILINTENGMGKGSARSIPSFHLYNALNTCRDYFTSFGGHEAAAGFQIPCPRINEFREQINLYARKNLKPDDFIPQVRIDTTLDFSQITRKFMDELRMLSPFGDGNEEPVFCSHKLRVAGVPKLIGNNLNHLTFFVKQDGKAFRVIAYNKGSYINLLDKLKDNPFSLAYTLKLNSWQGKETIELEFVDLKE